MVTVKTYAPPPVDRGEIFRYASCRRPGEREQELLDGCLAELGDALRYQVCFSLFPVRAEGGEVDLTFTRVRSADLARQLAGCGEALVFAATVGLELDRFIARYGRLSPARALMFQAIGAERIEALCDAFCADQAAELGRSGRGLTRRFSPGYGDLPLALQREIFPVLDCPRKIGLSLNDSLLMTPSKSVTALAGVTDCPAEGAPAGCAGCQKTDCAMRRTGT